VTYSPEDLVGCTIVWVNSNSTWKILPQIYNSHFLLEKVEGGWDLNRPGTKVDYPCGAIFRGMEIGAIEIVSSDFEVLT
jgi:hypothetical protein